MLKLNATTFIQTVKNDPEDRVQIEVGDSKQPDFKPQVKIMRWDNEVNFSLRAREETGATLLERPDGTIVYKAKDYEVHQYDKPDASEDGGFEFEWVLNAKPLSNVLTATIQSKGLSFFYQPALTPEEIAEGTERPDNVIGSYAVYHSTKANHKVGDKNYKCGKAFHIYRPKAIDANGTETWADLHIDETQGILTVTVPQKFLDDAVYPVRVDPTFGYTSLGASVTTIASVTSDTSTMVGNVHNLAEAGTLNKITAGVKTIGTVEFNADLYVALFREDSAGSGSHDKVAAVERTAVGITLTAAWQDFTAASESLTADDYVLASLGDGEDCPELHAVYVMNDDIGTSGNFYSESSTGAGGYATRKAENPWTEVAAGSTRRRSIYVTYTASGGAVTPTLMMMGVGT